MIVVGSYVYDKLTGKVAIVTFVGDNHLLVDLAYSGKLGVYHRSPGEVELLVGEARAVGIAKRAFGIG